jgi:hypothetical protein
MTRDEALERSIRRLLASTAELPASKRKRVKLPSKPRRESDTKRRVRDTCRELHRADRSITAARAVGPSHQSEPILSRT